MKDLLDSYAAGMDCYVATGSEAALFAIEELGRKAIVENLSLDEIAGLHEGATLALSGRGVRISEPGIIQRMSACLSALTVSAAIAYATRIDLLEDQRHQERQRIERDRQRLETLGQLVGSIAHELNNLLQPVQGMTEIMLADLPEKPPDRADLEVVLACSNQAVTVIRGILGYIRRETIAPHRVALGPAVASACDFLRPVLRQRLDVRIEDDSAQILAVEGALMQILMNLVQNAVQAEATQVRVRVDRCVRSLRGAARAAPKPCARLSVSDNGCGMAAEVMARATDPFFTTKADGAGTGLGLAIVRGIIVDWSGTLEIASEPGQGTSVTIHFPIVFAP